MARPIRVQYERAVYHVMARANERKRIFFTDKDRESFLSALAEMLIRFDVTLFSFCLMPNHYHLALQTLRGNLSQAMGWLQTTFTIRYNLWHQRTGHLFQGRFRAHLVEADSYAKRLVEYIHLNPVRLSDKQAPISYERLPFLNRYRWSSHLNYLGVRKNPSWLSLDWLKYWSEKSIAEAHEKYRAAISGVFGKPTTFIHEDLKGGLVLGTEEFYHKIKKSIGNKTGKEEARFSECEAAKIYQKKLREISQGEADKRVRMWLRVRFGGERLVSLAREFGYRDGSGVLHVVKGLERRAEKEKGLKRKLKIMEERISRFRS